MIFHRTRLSVGFVTLVSARLIQAALTLVLLKILTRVLAKPEVGDYYFIVATVSWFALIFLAPIGTWCNRHILEWKNRFTWSSILTILISFHLLIATMAVAVTIFANRAFGLDTNLGPNVLAMGLVSGIFCQNLFQLLSGLYNIIGSRVSYSVCVIITQLLVTGSVSVLLYASAISLTTWLAVSAVSYLASAGIFAVFLKKLFIGKEVARATELLNLKDLISFCGPIVAIAFATWVGTQGYRYLLSFMARFELLAVIGMGLGITTNIGSVVESVVQQYLYPELFQSYQDPNHKHRLWMKLFPKAILVFGLATAGMFFLAPLLLRLLIGNEYLDSTPYMRWGAIFEFFRMSVNFIYFSYIGEKRISSAVPAFVFGALITLTLYCLALFNANNLLLLLPAAIVFGTMSSFLILFLKRVRQLNWAISCRPVLVVGLAIIPFSLGLLIPVQSKILYICLYLLMFGTYSAAVLYLNLRDVDADPAFEMN